MKLVILETPYAGDTLKNLQYARLCMRDCLINHNESPFASHVLFTAEGVLDDTKPAERNIGIAAGFYWGAHATKTVVYTDRGISEGMKKGIEDASHAKRTIEFRTLNGYKETFTPYDTKQNECRKCNRMPCRCVWIDTQ